MPEYSSTTITPADGVQVPSMNGSTSGNFLLSALKSYILAEKGQANGLASLGSDGKLTAAQLPDLADDVIVVDSYSTLPAIGTASKIYITADNNKGYRWDPELTTPDYVKIFELDKSIVFGYYSSGSFYEDSEHTVQITPVEHVFYVDVSLADIYVLNDGTLIELLGTKWAKITDIQDGTITAGLATKAFQDAMGRAIITTYETKADASDLKSAIEGNSQRIENLEVAVSGSLVQTNTDSTMANTKTITNANSILPWAILKRVGARAVAWNQLINLSLATIKAKNTTGTWSDNVYTLDNKTFTVDEANQTVTVNGTAGSLSIQFFLTDNNPFGITHKIWMRGAKDSVNLKFTNNIDSAVTDTGDGRIFTSYANASCIVLLDISASSAPSNVVISPQITDIDVAGLSSYTTSQLKALLPANYPYHAPSIIPLNPSAFKVVGKNKWDEQWELGAFDYDTGAKTEDNNRIRSKNYIPVQSDTSYYNPYSDNRSVRPFFYDIEKKFITYNAFTRDTSGVFTTPTNCFFIMFNCLTDYGTTYNNNIMICLNSVTDKTYEEYKETTIDTSFTSDYKYVNENCHDYSENVLVNGVMRREEHFVVGEVDLSTLIWSPSGSVSGAYYATLTGYSFKQDCGGIMGKYNYIGTVSTGTSALSDYDKVVALYYNSNVPATREIYLRDTSLSDASQISGYFQYEKATPSTPTLHDPIPNIPCEDGTTITAVTPQTDIVNAIDVPSTIAYMTKISS